MIWLLIAICASSYSSPATLAKFNEKEACVSVAQSIRKISSEESGGGDIKAWCVPVPAASLKP